MDDYTLRKYNAKIDLYQANNVALRKNSSRNYLTNNTNIKCHTRGVS